MDSPAAIDLELRVLGPADAPPLLLLHGGPGAPRSLAPLPEDLARDFEVYEPSQRGRGDGPLTVDAHVADHLRLRQRIVDARGVEPAIVGHSWGAMLALVIAAATPGGFACVALVGCGTFDRASRAEYKRRFAAATDPALAARFAAVDDDPTLDEDERLRRSALLLDPIYAVDPILPAVIPRCDARANRESWADMIRLQEGGVYPDGFAAIDAPVRMFHGDDDPHPGGMIFASLRPLVRDLALESWPRCGHEPWRERAAREAFLSGLRGFVRAHARPPAAPRSQ
ncbi:MAG: alpha/beta hydrolase [Nannocystaceae bacterium]